MLVRALPTHTDTSEVGENRRHSKTDAATHSPFQNKDVKLRPLVTAKHVFEKMSTHQEQTHRSILRRHRTVAKSIRAREPQPSSVSRAPSQSHTAPTRRAGSRPLRRTPSYDSSATTAPRGLFSARLISKQYTAHSRGIPPETRLHSPQSSLESREHRIGRAKMEMHVVRLR